MKKKLVLTFPPRTVTKPITYHLVKDYNLVINIIYAKIEQGETGVLVAEIRGNKEGFNRAVEFLEKQGITVQFLAQDINLDQEKCVECGLCTGVCPTSALQFDSSWHIQFDKEKCILCENCIQACPTRAISLRI
jgi:ferredoxin